MGVSCMEQHACANNELMDIVLLSLRPVAKLQAGGEGGSIFG